MNSLSNFDSQHIWHPYTKIPHTIQNHLVTYAKDSSIHLGKTKVIDGMSSWWCVIHGYNNKYIGNAIEKQLNNFSHIMFGGLTHKAAINLTKQLIDLTPQGLDKIFYCDSGSVSVEVDIKIALQYWHNKKKYHKNKLLTVYGGYHGDTFGAMSVCDPINGMHHIFKNNLTKNIFCLKPTKNNTDKAIYDLEQKIIKNTDCIAAMIIEPIVQGAGGMNFYDKQYLKDARDLCNKYNILLIADEIATGFGRTGEIFAVNHSNIVPDILCIGKALTGGYLSLAATITSEKIATAVDVLMHGPTFMANPLACAAACASIKLLKKNNWQKKIIQIEHHLNEHLLPLKSHHKVADVRVLGAIGVVEFKDKIDIAKTQRLLIENGVWLRPFGKLLYTMPPFIIKNYELKILTNAISRAVYASL